MRRSDDQDYFLKWATIIILLSGAFISATLHDWSDGCLAAGTGYVWACVTLFGIAHLYKSFHS